jgi:hypothetical protein
MKWQYIHHMKIYTSLDMWNLIWTIYNYWKVKFRSLDVIGGCGSLARHYQMTNTANVRVLNLENSWEGSTEVEVSGQSTPYNIPSYIWSDIVLSSLVLLEFPDQFTCSVSAHWQWDDKECIWSWTYTNKFWQTTYAKSPVTVENLREGLKGA